MWRNAAKVWLHAILMFFFSRIPLGINISGWLFPHEFICLHTPVSYAVFLLTLSCGLSICTRDLTGFTIGLNACSPKQQWLKSNCKCIILRWWNLIPSSCCTCRSTGKRDGPGVTNVCKSTPVTYARTSCQCTVRTYSADLQVNKSFLCWRTDWSDTSGRPSTIHIVIN